MYDESMKEKEPANYQSYLLRLRRDHGQNIWKVWLQSTATENVFTFENVFEFWEFLKSRLGLEDDLINQSSSED